MITIFSTPKPFNSLVGVIQRNAIQSWTKLKPDCEVILFGNEDGAAEIAKELGIKHIVDIERNEYGTPLISSMFTIAQNVSRNEILCYANSDIILMGDFTKTINNIKRRPFLVVGQRTDIDVSENIDFRK